MTNEFPAAENPHDETRPWQEIATELSHETKTEKIADLAQELDRARNEEEDKRHQGTAA